MFNEKCEVEDEKSIYPFMSIIEHFVICEILSKEEYKSLEIDSNLVLVKPCEIKGVNYSRGEHVVNAINNSGVMEDCLIKANEFIQFIIEVKTTDGISSTASTYFSRSNGNTKEIVNNLFKKVLLDKKLIVPKALLVKYYIEVLIKKGESKQLQTFYAIYLYRGLFFLFEDDKSIDKFIQVLRANKWVEQITIESNKMLKEKDISSRKLKAIYRSLSNFDDIDLKYRCKSLATIYNFFKVEDTTVKLRNETSADKLVDFLENEIDFSIEHLIINDSQKIELQHDQSFDVPNDIKGNSKHVFNFIIIPKQLNRDLLRTKPLSEKIAIIEDEITSGKIKCEYSKKALELAKKSFVEYPNIEKDDNLIAKTKLSNYFEEKYRKEYRNFVQDIIDAFIIRLTQS